MLGEDYACKSCYRPPTPKSGASQTSGRVLYFALCGEVSQMEKLLNILTLTNLGLPKWGT